MQISFSSIDTRFFLKASFKFRIEENVIFLIDFHRNREVFLIFIFLHTCFKEYCLISRNRQIPERLRSKSRQRNTFRFFFLFFLMCWKIFWLIRFL